ncbi:MULTISPECIES: hypothetical protein [unclassified Pseudomonas]|uniref:hypothetical protein n=1 Tax=unclassified Pseudomonas TaxID=196821 RepID=UPI000C87859C|nr:MULTISPECIES: hypothetical protein [unclassified Pseudomonas]PMU10461.1 hypothetical protein C1Y11_11290 [Pseudomonas sp. FW305-20]PMU21107.1 hypothetical protein C1Y10_03960 [Pseudomonas sp. FW305-122]PMU41110.1 hypothetical protein C1Y12_08285 [Pseudomonas sp. FW305-47B]PMX64052.1 hypothetical protein C1Y13_04645 [Pseudomonas sp. FW305-33]PMX70832.1 hypothetical protein C1X12_04005 [Pseudomonas sp. FW305-60]
MPMIDSDKLKPASDAVLAAKQIWLATSDVLRELRERDPKNEHQLMLAQARAETARVRFETLAGKLVALVQTLIEQAEREG